MVNHDVTFSKFDLDFSNHISLDKSVGYFLLSFYFFLFICYLFLFFFVAEKAIFYLRGKKKKKVLLHLFTLIF